MEETFTLTERGWKVLAEIDRREESLGRRMTEEEGLAFLEGWERVMALLDGRMDDANG